MIKIIFFVLERIERTIVVKMLTYAQNVVSTPTMPAITLNANPKALAFPFPPPSDYQDVKG